MSLLLLFNQAAAGGAYTLVADGGTYNYSGNNANLLYNLLLTAEGGTYTYSGNNASLIYTPVGSYTLTAHYFHYMNRHHFQH